MKKKSQNQLCRQLWTSLTFRWHYKCTFIFPIYLTIKKCEACEIYSCEIVPRNVGLGWIGLGWVNFCKRLLYKGMSAASWKMKLKEIIFAKEYSTPTLWTTLDKSLYFPEPPWILFLILDGHEIEKKLAEMIIHSSHNKIFYEGCLYLVIQFPKIIRCS